MKPRSVGLGERGQRRSLADYHSENIRRATGYFRLKSFLPRALLQAPPCPGPRLLFGDRCRPEYGRNAKQPPPAQVLSRRGLYRMTELGSRVVELPAMAVRPVAGHAEDYALVKQGRLKPTSSPGEQTISLGGPDKPYTIARRLAQLRRTQEYSPLNGSRLNFTLLARHRRYRPFVSFQHPIGSPTRVPLYLTSPLRRLRFFDDAAESSL